MKTPEEIAKRLKDLQETRTQTIAKLNTIEGAIASLEWVEKESEKPTGTTDPE